MVKFQGDKLLGLVVASRKKQMQFLEILAHSIRLDNLNRRKEGVVNLKIKCFQKWFSFQEGEMAAAAAKHLLGALHMPGSILMH